ncbi:MAG: ThuA domain-containing protein [Bacteroidota bacterium]
MLSTRFTTLLLVICLLMSCGPKKRSETRLLVFSKTAGFRHASIPAGQEALMKLGKDNGFVVDTTEDASVFHEETLRQYSAVIFLNTTLDIFDAYQQNAFQRYIQAGGGFVGIHGATDTEYDWPWFGKLVGAYFNGHPNNPNVLEGKMNIVDNTHPSTQHFKLSDPWIRSDEFYNFKDLYYGDHLSDGIIPLINIDETSYEGGTNGEFHPMTWYHDFDGGRSWYTNFGHTPETFSEPEFLQMLLGGITYAVGENVVLDYTKAKAPIIPDPSRFVVSVLDEELQEPGELEVMSNGNILFTERRGDLKMYDPAKKETKVVGHIDVYTQKEDGLVGLALDPNFASNQFLYLYYAPPEDDPKFVLSRFRFMQDSLINASEKIILEVPVQRQECCHTGGSIQFGPDGLLYLSTGDDTNPFDTGYSPSDERAGRGPWDAQKSSASPGDLRGKVLRIKLTDKGGYEIPDGNLFPKDGSGGRPEIYVMGCRNPYRISIDHKTGYLYWGDVGPDARKDSSRGPKGHDEVNQARQAGFFGWPLFIGDNKPYREVDFTNNSYGEFYDANKPINNSPNNTGPQELPPAQKAFIWYPYDGSKEFPIVGEGGRNAMAGPVYYADMYPNAKSKFPAYYEGKLFIYDFMRDWVLLASMDKTGDLQTLEHFLPDLELSSPMDMEFGPDGALYILEYGTRWFARNEDARLIRIDYAEGNRAPVARMIADATVGAAPFSTSFSAASSFDHDKGDQLTYSWDFGTGDQAEGQSVQYTFEKAGIYQTVLTVSDQNGDSNSSQLEVRVGNGPPEIVVAVEGNKTFFWKERPFKYIVDVVDKEDGSLSKGQIPAEAVGITFDFLGGSFDKTIGEQGHAAVAEASILAVGEELITSSGCIACHGIEQKVVGPAYQDVAKKYEKLPNAVQYLTGKILNGGSGVWGGAAMPAQSQLNRDDARKMASFILSLNSSKAAPSSLAPAGTLTTKQHNGLGEGSTYTLRISYTDKGGDVIGPLNAFSSLTLRSAKLEAETRSQKLSHDGNQRHRDTEQGEVIDFKTSGYIAFERLDMTDLHRITLRYSALEAGASLEFRLGSPDGPKIGELSLAATGDRDSYQTKETNLNISSGGFQDVYLLAKHSDETEAGAWQFRVDWIYFHPPQNL